MRLRNFTEWGEWVAIVKALRAPVQYEPTHLCIPASACSNKKKGIILEWEHFATWALMFVRLTSLFEVPHSPLLVNNFFFFFLPSSFRTADTAVLLIWPGDNTEKPFSLIAALWTATPTLSTSYPRQKLERCTPQKTWDDLCSKCTITFFCILLIYQVEVKVQKA